GLGLTLVWSIARELDGVLRLEDSPWGGARATLLLPRGPSPDAGLPVPLSAVGVPREAPMILVVDDQAFIGELIQEMLEPQGFRVETVTDPRVALQGLRGGALRPDLLLVDARMPDLDGRELAVAVHRQRPGLPIVLVSGYTGPSEVDGEAVKALAGFLRKPFTVDALLDVVRPLLGRSP
ncbi:MAG: response regulator, partial [Deltaproteobacteria bacterium]|nr:response regulator [Deltaproteobacteria bacterium]